MANMEIAILQDKYATPIKVIVYMDTGARKMMVKLEILPSYMWKPYKEKFKSYR